MDHPHQHEQEPGGGHGLASSVGGGPGHDLPSSGVRNGMVSGTVDNATGRAPLQDVLRSHS